MLRYVNSAPNAVAAECYFYTFVNSCGSAVHADATYMCVQLLQHVRQMISLSTKGSKYLSLHIFKYVYALLLVLHLHLSYLSETYLVHRYIYTGTFLSAKVCTIFRPSVRIIKRYAKQSVLRNSSLIRYLWN